MRTWSRKADNARDLLVYEAISDCRRNHKHRGKSVYDCSRERLPKHITYDEDSGMARAFTRGKRLERGQLQRRKVGRRRSTRQMDIVEVAAIVYPVYEALEKGFTKSQAYHYAKLALDDDGGKGWRLWANCKPLSERAIRAVFENFEKQLSPKNR